MMSIRMLDHLSVKNSSLCPVGSPAF